MSPAGGSHAAPVQHRAAVLGSPISHSKSPALHAAAYGFLGAHIGYSRADVSQEQLQTFIDGPGADPSWIGWSVTMPLKSAMVEHMTTLSPRVQTLGVLNTVVISSAAGGRRLHGENTDVDGIVAALRQEAAADSMAYGGSGRMAIIGAGGTAAAALGAAAELGCADAVLYVRSPQRAASVAALAPLLGLAAEIRPLETLPADLQTEQPCAVVSTLPPRAADEVAGRIGETTAQNPAGGPLLLDAAYDPWPSALAQAWQRRGWPVTSGLEMLLHQAVKQVELFTAGTEADAARLSPAEHAHMVNLMRSALSGED
ncbi:shikimate dehydrogenase [Nesterenkonia sp.]|uniref:shikimate dehydrogenase family protein n=1 Tax=Nesterenkonia sp. TaxID=704201 RepID=UPI0026112CA2|nr:shikimate dehydrogenase [Nesterenkonia sp.]